MGKIIPDLLFKSPRMITQGTALEAALNDAFFMGKPNRALEQAIHGVSPAGSWDPDYFARSLFLEELLHDCFQLTIEGLPTEPTLLALKFLIQQPACDLETIQFRQEINRELIRNPQLAPKVEQLYRSLRWMAHLINSAMQGVNVSYTDKTRWQLKVLQQTKLVVDLMADQFQGLQSGLARLERAGKEMRSSEQYTHLAALLDYDRHMMDLTVALRVGADGYLTDFRVMKLRENTGNPFHRSSTMRFFSKLGLLFRGYHFSDSELVGNLIEKVFVEFEPWLMLFLQVMGQLECYLAGLAFRERAQAHGLAVCLPLFGERDNRLEWHNLFNPLLFLQNITPVPTSVRAAGGSTTLITGPNSGGKTRLLQALGITQVLAQAGLFIPASAATLTLADGLFVSLAEDVKVKQAEGQLGLELLRIRELFEKCSQGSLILVDELCSGTNPSEGIEILEMLLKVLPKLRSSAFISTHFLEFARELEQTGNLPGLAFLRVHLNARHEPSYTFVPGVAQTSLAQATARRLGVTLDDLNHLLATNRSGAATDGCGLVAQPLGACAVEA